MYDVCMHMYVCMYVCTYINTYIHTCVYIYIYIHTHTHTKYMNDVTILLEKYAGRILCNYSCVCITQT
jgi:hypothetical protein